MRTLTVALGALALVPAAALAAGAFDGTWKVNLSRIQLPQKPDIHVIKDGEYTCVSGAACRLGRFTIKADGSDQPIQGDPRFDTLAIRIVDAQTVESVVKLRGQPVASIKTTASADGSTLTTEETILTDARPEVETVWWSRVGNARAGEHPTSGTWQARRVAISDSAVLAVTYGITDEGFSESSNGVHFDAKFDGKQYPVVGSQIHEMVTAKRLGPASVELTFSVQGNVVEISHRTVSADGKTIQVVNEEVPSGRTTRYTEDKVS